MDLKARLDRGRRLPSPDGILINGRSKGATLNVEQGKTYRFRISNVGLQNSLNFRIQNHRMKLVEVEGTDTMQTMFSSLDDHVGQPYFVLITADQSPRDYYGVASSRFTNKIITITGILRCSGSSTSASGPIPGGPTIEIDWSFNQARAIRTNLKASGPRPNPQGSYHYGLISLTIVFGSSAGQINGKQTYDFFKINGVYKINSISDKPTGGGIYLDTSVLQVDYRTFIKIVFENKERTKRISFKVIISMMDGGHWNTGSRNGCNLRDAVYPKSWTAIYIALDNVGLWNLWFEFWARQYLGQHL
ncbi:unnamed protein product, partial [Eruca vesicaria subsp. sativa]|nr:unnamed protein product [Eruca vesicaria subsp. sativa]